MFLKTCFILLSLSVKLAVSPNTSTECNISVYSLSLNNTTLTSGLRTTIEHTKSNTVYQISND